MSAGTGERTVRETQIWQHQAGSGARNDDMDNICELLINAVSASKPKMLTGLNQKVRGMDSWLYISATQSSIPPAERQALSR